MLNNSLNHIYEIKHRLLYYRIFTSNNIDSIKDYMYPYNDKENKIIFNDNNKKAGIYMFTNKLNNKRYIGSAVDLNKRISRYFQKYYLNNIRFKNILIIKAIRKYGIDNFYISILEYVNNEKLDLIKREQFWLDSIKPEYNILKIANSSLGYKHTKEAKLKISLAKLGKKLSPETKKNISSSLKLSKLVGHKHSLEVKLKLKEIASKRTHNLCRNIFVSVKNVYTGEIIKYKSVREAAKNLKADTRSIRSRIPNRYGVQIKPRNAIRSILFRNKYLIELIPSNLDNNK